MKRLARITNLLGFCSAIAFPAVAVEEAEEEPALATFEVESSEAKAERLFREGRALLKERKYEDACPKFEESEKLDGALGTLLNLGVCYEEWGRLASARRVYERVASRARERAQPEREALARERIAAVDLVLAHVVLDFEGEPPASVSLDGVLLTTEEWNRPLRVDPGTHRLEVTSAGKRRWSRSIEVTRSQRLSLVVPALDPGPEHASPVRSPAPPARAVERPSAAGDPADARTKVSPAVLVLGGVGAGAAIVGSVFGVLAYSTNVASDDECGSGNACSVEGVRLREKAFDQASISTIAFSVAAAGAASAVTLWLIERTPGKSNAAVRVGGKASPSHLELDAGVVF